MQIPMKRTYFLLSAALCLGVLGAPVVNAQTRSDSEIFDEQTGQLLEALVGQQLRDAASQLQTQNQMMAEQNKIVRKLNTQIVAEAKFEDASLKHLTDYVRSMSKELDPDNKPLNLIITPAATKEANGKAVNLNLTNVPLGIVMKYALQQLGLTYRVDQYVVVIDVPQRVGMPGANPNLAPQRPSRTPAQPATPVR